LGGKKWNGEIRKREKLKQMREGKKGDTETGEETS